ncbi:uncharacterized protein LTR77_008021 [Saxophila tyrrhenica]|uniref:Mitochondrial ribosomal protein L1 n=1 Tax=Saxophila tyrrhenica TaxID=1690608 RepID=A0AAV9P4K7_9PEZI|nr:hypothetical protein LTR77_008021 [Saxophila tyrrhenica]
MALPSRYCPSCLSSLRPTRTALAFRPSPFLAQHQQPPQQKRHATGLPSARAAMFRSKNKDKEGAARRKKKARAHYTQPDLKQALQFSLVDAMRYLRAAEVGRPPTSAKYELHIRLRTVKNGPVVRNRMRLPHPIDTTTRIAVICPPDSKIAKDALAAGAQVVGEESIFEAVKEGRIEFDRCLCHTDSLPKLSKAGVARILGPRQLMPSAKTNTVVKDVGAAVKGMVGASEYREREGVVRMGVGQLGFGPEEVQKNIAAFVGAVKRDIGALADRVSKGVHEIVLSSTNGPGLSLNGEVRGEGSVDTRDVSVVN